MIAAGPATRRTDDVLAARENLKDAINKAFVGLHWPGDRDRCANDLLAAIDALITARMGWIEEIGAIMRESPRLNDKAQREIESSFDNTRESFRLLKLIDAEFQSDPMSVQCFDMRIVERVRYCVALREQLARQNPLLADED